MNIESTSEEQMWLQDMSRVYSRLQDIVKEEYETTLEQFLMDYYGLSKNHTVSRIKD